MSTCRLFKKKWIINYIAFGQEPGLIGGDMTFLLKILDEIHMLRGDNGDVN